MTIVDDRMSTAAACDQLWGDVEIVREFFGA